MTYENTADLYDLFLQNKDYPKEVDSILRLVAESFDGFAPASVLDVACGTGRHLSAFSSPIPDLSGLDLSEPMLEIARKRVPDVALHRGDMVRFDLGQRFDLVTCLFSSIAYAVHSTNELASAIARMYAHVNEPGVLVVEPGFAPAGWVDGRLAFREVRTDHLNAVRMSTAERDGAFAVFDEHYVVSRPSGTEHRLERHRFRLFETREYLAAFDTLCGTVVYDVEGPTGRGLLLCGKGR